MEPTWTDVAQALATIAAVLIALFGFPLLIFQIKQLERSIRGDTHEKLYNQSLEIMNFLFQYPSLRPYVYEGKELEANDIERGHVDTLMEMLGDYLEHILLQMPNLPGDIRPYWKNYVRDMLRSSPELQRYLHIRRQWYSEELRQMATEVASVSIAGESAT
jgi:hypothetical protein